MRRLRSVWFREPAPLPVACPRRFAALSLHRTVISRLRHAAHVFFVRLWKPIVLPAWRATAHAVLYHPWITATVFAVALLATAGIWWFIRSRRPSAEELERRRREYLTLQGRITDGHILDARTLAGEETTEPTPEVLVYSYRLAGVVYNCAQDVSMLSEQVRNYRIDQPINVRYDPRHPGNSILVSETWSGLWQKPSLQPMTNQTQEVNTKATKTKAKRGVRSGRSEI